MVIKLYFVEGMCVFVIIEWYYDIVVYSFVWVIVVSWVDWFVLVFFSLFLIKMESIVFFEWLLILYIFLLYIGKIWFRKMKIEWDRK